jgi:hypothetical protein
MKERGRLKRVRRAASCTAATAAVVVLVIPAPASARGGAELRQRSLHLALSSIATRGYVVGVETLGHHQVTMFVQKGSQFATYTVKGKVNRHRIKADFGRFGRVSLHFHGKPQRFQVLPEAKRKQARRHCRGRQPEREVGHFRGAIEFKGQHDFTKLAVGKTRGEVRRSYRQVCFPLHQRQQAGISSSASASPLGFTLSVLTASSHVNSASIRFEAISLESPLGIRLPGEDLPSIVSTSLRQRVGRIRVLRSTFQSVSPLSIRVSPPHHRPATARVALDSPYSGSAHYKGPSKGSPPTWTGSLSVRLLGSGALPLTGPSFRATLCHASAFNPRSVCFRRAEASAARAAAPTPILWR